MMKKLLYVSSILFLLSSCAEEKPAEIPVLSEESKLVISSFESEMLTLCKTSNTYLDSSLAAIEAGITVDSLDTEILNAIAKNEEAVKDLSMEFRTNMKLHGIQQKDVASVHQSLSNCFKSVQEKHQKLQDLGAKLGE